MGKKIISSQELSQIQTFLPEGSSSENKSEEENNPEKIWEQKVEQAYQKGFEEGMAKGLAKLNEEIERLNSLLKQISEERAQLYRDVEKDLVELSIAIAEQVVGAISERDRERVLDVVKRAIEALSDKSEITIYVSMEDESILLEAKDKILDGIKGEFKIVADTNIPKGGCIVQGKAGRIDALLSTQLEEVRKRLLG